MKHLKQHPIHPTSSFASTGTKPELRRTCQGAGPLVQLSPVALDRTFAVPVQPATMEAKEENRKIGSIPPFGGTEPGMSPQSQSPTSNLSSHQSGRPFPVGGEIEPLVGADSAAEFLQVSPRRILELARRGALPGYPLGTGTRHLWRFRLSELARLCSQAGYNASGSLTCPEEKSEMAQRHQRGWLKKERRKEGETWMLFFRTTRKKRAASMRR